jgi:signal transduction histidine kinase
MSAPQLHSLSPLPDLLPAPELRDSCISLVSHEIRTPLTALKMQIELVQRLLQTNRESELLPELVAKSLQQIDDMTKLVKDLFDASAFEAGRLILCPEPVDLVQLISETVDRFKSDALPKSSMISFSYNSPVSGAWDKNRMSQVVSNLLGNAIKYGQNKPIEIMLTARADTIQIAVRDQGIGIPHQELERIFERYERGSADRRLTGLGLGLYIVRQILTACGGKVWAESTLGQGTLFICEFPVTPLQSAE